MVDEAISMPVQKISTSVFHIITSDQLSKYTHLLEGPPSSG